mmetsp:Transcript_16869/g.51116  ORF Transcript_16869/g.51116 Transcript_16869/m.51116 type:complete len:111 (-) Transcript_16869:527-859(-)
MSTDVALPPLLKSIAARTVTLVVLACLLLLLYDASISARQRIELTAQSARRGEKDNASSWTHASIEVPTSGPLGTCRRGPLKSQKLGRRRMASISENGKNAFYTIYYFGP